MSFRPFGQVEHNNSAVSFNSLLSEIYIHARRRTFHFGAAFLYLHTYLFGSPIFSARNTIECMYIMQTRLFQLSLLGLGSNITRCRRNSFFRSSALELFNDPLNADLIHILQLTDARIVTLPARLIELVWSAVVRRTSQLNPLWDRSQSGL